MDYQSMNCLTEFDVESAIKTWREDGYEDGYNEGKTDGMTAGKQEKAVETARNFLMESVNPEIIARCTGLPLEEVNKLAEEIAKTTA